MPAGTVIVGTGQAGFQTAASLRAEGYLEPITLIGEEPHIPYQRPPLSKGFLMGKQDTESIELRPGAFYHDHQINLIAGRRIAAIECAERRVRLAAGGRLPYDALVLAVGARNRTLSIPGADLDGVLYLRSLEESIVIKERLAEAEEIVVIGGGFIGLELAAAARSLGKAVTVIEALPRLMPRVVAPVISDFFRELHTSRGVNVLCGCAVSEISGAHGRVREVRLSDGAVFPADLVLVGIGVLPNVELAQGARLPIANGIVVDDHLRTADERIYSIGDCADHPNPFAGARVRLESVQNAADQAQCAAAAIAGRSECYSALPWFWTDQFEIKLQMAGLSGGYDNAVMRGDPGSQKISVFYFKDDRLIAIDSINRPADHMFGRKIIASRMRVTPEQAADESVDLKALARQSPSPRGS